MKFHFFFEDEDNIYIVLEYCENQTLSDLLRQRGPLSEMEAARLLREAALAVECIHKNHVIHRDLKLGNLFLTKSNEIRVGDFGLATKITREGLRKRFEGFWN